MEERHLCNDRSFNEIEVGNKVEFYENIDMNRHVKFRDLFEDFSPVHNDKSIARHSNYNDVIGYGFMLNGFLSKLYGEYLPGGSSICIKQESNFRKAFYIGDTIKIVGKVIDKIESTKFVVIESKMYRNNDELIFTGEGIVQVIFNKLDNILLYKTSNDNCVTGMDFINVLKKLGIKSGDTLFIHSDISKFGKLAVKKRDVLLGNIIDSFKSAVGNCGTLIMPAFSYSFCKGEIFDVENTKGTVGTLNEYFRRLPGVSRSVQPIFSAAVMGKNKDKFLNISKDSFGKDSIFDKLKQANGKLVFFGASFHSCTYLHYVEQMHKIPYRYMKEFNGKIKDGEKIYEDRCTFFVRYLNSNVVLDTSRLEKYLLENKIMKEASIGNGEILVIGAKELYNAGFKLLDEDIYYFLKEKPNIDEGRN
jgi:aminoglycoside 3-N-acetyltransferase